jgi:hypothetical protein
MLSRARCNRLSFSPITDQFYRVLTLFCVSRESTFSIESALIPKHFEQNDVSFNARIKADQVLDLKCNGFVGFKDAHSGAAQMEWPNPLGCGPAYSAAACNAAAAAARKILFQVKISMI